MTPNMIGAYGDWGASLIKDEPAELSFRNPTWTDIERWRTTARQKFLELLSQPDSGETPEVRVKAHYIYDGLHIEELEWQLPYGAPTQAVFLKPAAATGKLPGIVALHDHGGRKYFGKRKITRTNDSLHPMMEQHQTQYYGGVAWANVLAKRGYAVLVPDTFTFASRRVLLQDVPPHLRDGLSDDNPEVEANIEAYHQWAAAHESILAKSLFCAGTTWPGVFLGEDQRALDVLCAREDVDTARIGCGGLSGGGLRTVYLAGADPRIQCAVCVGMMTTWRDYLLHKAHTHTWMIYVPQLPKYLDYAEVLGLRVPQPTLVLNNVDDALFTMPEMERADTILGQVYAKAEAQDAYGCSFYPGPHKFDLEMQAEAFTWFDRWLG